MAENQQVKLYYDVIGDIKYHVFNAGSFYSDGGASFGILPKAVWRKEIPSDEKNRIEVACNLMLLQTPVHNILVDTGVGFVYDDKIAKIYTPEPTSILKALKMVGLSCEDIDAVVLTHLHHDHIGGLVYKKNEQFLPMFPEAKHYIQQNEWETARNPDDLNAGAYRYQIPLEVLENHGLKCLVDGDYSLTDDISLLLVGGHSIGSQALRILTKGKLLYYPADIIPQKFHLNPAVTSAYDISRQQTVASKKKILEELQELQGRLIFNHQVGDFIHDFKK